MTTYETLNVSDNFFSALIRAEAADKCECDNVRTVYVDRDPTHFRYVLNSMRGSCVLPDSRLALSEIAIEADYYNLFELRDMATGMCRHLEDMENVARARQENAANQISIVLFRLDAIGQTLRRIAPHFG